MNERDELRLRHIVDAAERIASYLQGVDQASFLSNPMLQDAVIRNLEVIGEACVNLSPGLTDANADIPWHKARRSRQAAMTHSCGLNSATLKARSLPGKRGTQGRNLARGA